MSFWALLPVLGLLVLFIGLTVWLRRYATGPGGGEGMKVVGHRRLDGQNTLFLVEVDGRRLLLGTGRDGVRVLRDCGPIDGAG